ncbi:MAG TPA: response regulator transcription factor [Gaiellaceae bacterium]
MSAAVLLAEPEPQFRGLLERQLSVAGFAVVEAGAGAEALTLAEQALPDLVLVGNELPDATAAELCRRLREGEPGRSWNREVPVIVLGAADSDAVDRVQAFERGCDDYLTQPFHHQELVARIHAVLRRAAPDARQRLVAGEIELDRQTRRVTVAGERVFLAAKEFELLVKLAGAPHRVFSKEELLREVWGFRSIGRTRTVDSHASRLRRKLARPGAGPFVINEWGVGYRLLDG